MERKPTRQFGEDDAMRTTNVNPQTDKNGSGRVFWKRVDFWVILLLLAVAAAFYRDSWQEIREGIRQITWRELLHCILLSLAAYVLEGMTIACMMSAVRSGSDCTFPVKRGTAIAYLCEFYRLITLGSGSGFAEIYYLHKSGIETGTATVLTMLQYVCKRIAILTLGCLGGLTLCCGHRTSLAYRELFREYAVFIAAGCMISIGVIAAFLSVAVSAKITNVITGLLDWAGVRFPSFEKKGCEWKRQVTLLNRFGGIVLGKKREITCVILLQGGKLFLFYSIPAYLLHEKAARTMGWYDDGADAAMGWIVCVLLMAVVYMLAGIIPAPSGAGSLEFVFLLFFSGMIRAQVALPAILVFRFATWIVPFLIGGAVKIRNSSA